MKISSVYSSGDHLKAADLQGQPRQLTITGWREEEFERQDGGKTKKLVLSFAGTERTLVVNKTNGAVLVQISGDETDNLLGKQIELRSEKVMYAGNFVDGIRIYPVAQAAASAQPAQPAAPATPQPAAPLDDDLPF